MIFGKDIWFALRPKNRGPFQRVPVMSRAEELSQVDHFDGCRHDTRGRDPEFPGTNISFRTG
jgi:hypothetical protein